MNDRIFQEDEWTFLKPASGMTPEGLLRQEGLFHLQDIVDILDCPIGVVLDHANRLAEAGQDPLARMGLRKVFNRWIVRMAAFAPYYRRCLRPRWQAIPPDWDGNRLLSARGVFRLSQVARRIPFRSHQLRHRAKKHPDARRVLGVWKDAESGFFLVDMAVFGPWIKRVWRDA